MGVVGERGGGKGGGAEGRGCPNTSGNNRHDNEQIQFYCTYIYFFEMGIYSSTNFSKVN